MAKYKNINSNMNKIKKDIPLFLSLLGGVTLAVVTKGVALPAFLSVMVELGNNITKGEFAKITPSKIKNWLTKFHPDQLNHSIKKLFVHSVNEALNNIYVLFTDKQVNANEKKEARRLLQILQKKLPDMLLNNNQILLDDPEIKNFLYEENSHDNICNFINTQFEAFGITEPFKSFLAQHLPFQIQLCFGEGLKDPSNQNAWIAFQRMLIEEIRNDIKQISDTQQSIKDDLSDLKFEKSGFSKEQTAEIHQFINLLNDKKLVEIKIKSGINKSLQSIENKANEIIRITTTTKLTVDELKVVVEKINKQNRIIHLFLYVFFAILLIIIGFFFFYIINKYAQKKRIADNSPTTTRIIDASLLGKNVLLDISLMDYQDVVNQITEDEKYAFDESYPNFQYIDTIINGSYSIIPHNIYYNNYFNKNYIDYTFADGWSGGFPQVHACFLDVKIVNNSDATLILDKILIDVEESKTDQTPFLYVFTDDRFTSKLFFVNQGYGKWEGFDFEFTFLKDDQTFDGAYSFKTYIPYFENRFVLDLKPYIESFGFDYERLLKETSAKAEDNYILFSKFIPQNELNDSLINIYKKYTHPFPLEVFHEDFGLEIIIRATLIGRLTFHDFPLCIDLKSLVFITTDGGWGDSFNLNFSAFDIKLRDDGENYQIKYPVSISLKPNEAERLALKFTAEKTSHHKLKVALDNINGIDIKSNLISLSIFHPIPSHEILDPD